MPRPNLIMPGGFFPLHAKPSDLVELEITSAFAADIYPGDPLIGVTAGSVGRTPAGSAAGAATDGITAVCVEIVQYKDAAGFVRKNARFIPSGTAWTNHFERSLVLAVLVTEEMRFKVKVSGSNASLAVARATRFANADHLYSGADPGLGVGGAQLNLATVGTTATLQWRIVGFTDLSASDPLQSGYQAIVVPNLPYALPIKGHLATAI
jgi:hypothetical protein